MGHPRLRPRHEKGFWSEEKRFYIKMLMSGLYFSHCQIPFIYQSMIPQSADITSIWFQIFLQPIVEIESAPCCLTDKSIDNDLAFFLSTSAEVLSSLIAAWVQWMPCTSKCTTPTWNISTIHYLSSHRPSLSLSHSLFLYFSLLLLLLLLLLLFILVILLSKCLLL